MALRLCELPYSAAAQQDLQRQPPPVGEPPHTAAAEAEQQPALGSPLRLGGPATQLMERGESGRPPGHVVIVTTGRAQQVGCGAAAHGVV